MVIARTAYCFWLRCCYRQPHMLKENRAHKDAYLYFVWPQDGTVIKGAFWCRFGLRNMGVTHAGDDFENAGTIICWLT